MPETPKRKFGGPQEGAGRKPLPPERQKRTLTLKIARDLYAWIKTQPPGTAERLLREAEIAARTF